MSLLTVLTKDVAQPFDAPFVHQIGGRQRLTLIHPHIERAVLIGVATFGCVGVRRNAEVCEQSVRTIPDALSALTVSLNVLIDCPCRLYMPFQVRYRLGDGFFIDRWQTGVLLPAVRVSLCCVNRRLL